ncbi:hypothetical protein MPC4_70076 [Methylocella tundrae]|uniref:Uncharacterized protein n=1 Tax=Methylocella tundrae TaxID=227605 RepID=A0A8B6MD00_METTU|nr:hypothetical protein MPC1_910004 [Methylocella tundrae]VTZ52188.1 hypothetical protein MPC4_70076 [Methylocella tundrae]
MVALRLRGDVGLEVRGHVALGASQPQPLKGAANAIGELPEDVKIDRLASNRLRFELFALDGHQRAATRKLALAFAQAFRAAKIGDYLGQDIAKPARFL